MLRPLLNLTLCAGLSLVAFAQDPGAAIKNGSSSEAMGQTAANQAELVFRNIQAVNYQHRAGRTQVDFRGADLMPQVTGKAGVDSKTGRTEIDAKFENLRSANTFGLEYLTYVLWAVTPEGRARNLGEVVVKDNKGELRATTDLQAFGLILTAEPYFAVSQPSNLVVAENVVRPDTKGTQQAVNARYELLPRGMYAATNQPIRDTVYGVDKKAPLDLLEARNAMRIARTAQAERYASASFQKAEQELNQAEDNYRRKEGKSSISTAARAAAQTAEEARVMALRQQNIERVEAERRAQAERVATAQAQAEAEARQRQMAEAERMRAEAARHEAETMRQQALTEAQRAEAERQQAEAAKASALAQQQAAQSQAEQARMAAQQSEQARLKAERDREEMRARLLQQLNQVLQTRDTARGLIVNMSDVLFDTGKATLKPGARERLARVAGIIVAYPDLKLQIEGHTDSVGSDELNRRLSEERAEAVREYLASQGVPVSAIVARGLGKSQPIASNATAAGRQLNRRVDMVVSGESIGNMSAWAAPGAIPSSAPGGTTGQATAPAGGAPSVPETAPAVGAPAQPTEPTRNPGPPR